MRARFRNIFQNMKFRYIFVNILILSSLFFTIIVQGISSDNNAFAQVNQLNQSAVIFRNVAIDPNPVPNKPFKVSAIISVSDIQRRHVVLSLAVPSQVSVAGPAIVDLGDISSLDRERMTTWTLIASASGSFPLNLTAYSSSVNIGNVANNFQFNSFPFNVSIGSLKSLIVSKVSVPGDILPNNIFKATVNLKNTGTIPAYNVIAQLSVPSGLQLMDNVASNIPSMNPGQEVPLTWNLKAQTPCSCIINLNYSSTNAGSGVLQAAANVGQPIISNIRPSMILLAGSDLESSSVGPGDKNLPLNITLINDGTLPLVNVTAVLELGEPFFWSYKQNDKSAPIETHTQTFRAGTLKSGQSQVAAYYVNVRKSADPDIYANHLRIYYSEGKQQFQRTYDIPIVVSPNTALMVVSQPAPISPGSYTPINFHIVNKGEVPLHSIQILSSATTSPTSTTVATQTSTTTTSSNPVSSASGPYLSIDTPFWIGDLGAGENKTLSLKVYTPAERVTQQPLPITIGYEANGKHTSQTFMVGVKFIGEPSFQIQTVKVTPPLTYPGSVAERIDVNFINTGYVIANNVSAQLANMPSGITPAWGGATYQYFGRILPNQNFTGSFFLNINNNVSSLGYPLPLLMKFNDQSSEMLNLNFLVSPKAKFSLVGVDSTGLYPGASNIPLRINLKNTGNAIAQTMTTKFLGGNAVPGVKSSTVTAIGNTENIGDLAPGENFATTFIINPDPQSATPGQQAASVQITWTQTDTSDTSQTTKFLQTVPITYNVAQGPSYLLYYQGIPWTYVGIAFAIIILAIVFLRLRKRKIISETQMHLQGERQLANDNGNKMSNPLQDIDNGNKMSNPLRNLDKKSVDATGNQ
jgi:hypothetical protein